LKKRHSCREGKREEEGMSFLFFSLSHSLTPPPFYLLTSATMNKNAVTEATRLVKSGSRAMPGRNTKKANKWNHFLIHMEEGLHTAKQ
jgi:hypothetical protein